MKTLVRQKIIKREDLRSNRLAAVYLFGDNELRTGLGGQAAAMRGEPNAIGIRVKARPTTEPDAFWTDATFEENLRKINEDIVKIYDLNYRVIVIPLDGIGTGRAKLEQTAPRTFLALQEELRLVPYFEKAEFSQIWAARAKFLFTEHRRS